MKTWTLSNACMRSLPDWKSSINRLISVSLFTWEIFSLDIHSIRLLERIEKEIRHAWSENHRIARQMLHSHVSSDLVEWCVVRDGFTSACDQPMLRYFDDLMMQRRRRIRSLTNANIQCTRVLSAITKRQRSWSKKRYFVPRLARLGLSWFLCAYTLCL